MSSYLNVSDLDVSGWNEEALGMCVVEADEVENARLVLCRALGLPEPELYDDQVEDDQENISDDSEAISEDWEHVLNEVIELQERMSSGMKLIEECRVVMNRGGLEYGNFLLWRAREKKLWNHWWNLKKQCDELIGDNRWLWNRYFSLARECFDRTGYTGNETECPWYVVEYDTMRRLYLDSEDCVEE